MHINSLIQTRTYLIFFAVILFSPLGWAQEEQKGAKDEKKAASNGQLKLALTRMNTGDFTGAIEHLNQAISLYEKNYDAYLKRAFCQGANGNYQGAIDDYTVVIQANPGLEPAYLSRGSAKNKLKMYKEAILDFDRCIQLSPDDYEAYNNRGWAKKGLGDDNGACKDWHYSKQKGNGEAKIILKNNRCK